MRTSTADSKYTQRNADSFAESARDARIRGETGRAVALYEHALHFQIDAINLSAANDIAEQDELLDLHMRAASYAVACGRQRKARHLLKLARTLGMSDAQEAAVLERIDCSEP